jgi:hypothetical protein
VPAASTLASSPATQTTHSAEAASVENGPDPLDRLLAMRSIKINLTTRRPDGSSRVMDVEIDAAGSLHVTYSLPVLTLTGMPKGFDPKQLLTSREGFAIRGKVYQPDPQKTDWKNTPLQENYGQSVSEELHGVDGLALYLDLLPEGSIQVGGKNNVGGFAVDKIPGQWQSGGPDHQRDDLV